MRKLFQAFFAAVAFVASPAPAAPTGSGSSIAASPDPYGFGVCGGPATRIHEIQGPGRTTPLPRGTRVVVEGVVVGDFQDPAHGLGGFFVQEEDADVDDEASTSEGLFVYDAGAGLDVDSGQVVRVHAEVREFFGQTELGRVSRIVACDRAASPVAARVVLPVALASSWERWEGMRVRVEQPLVASGHHDLARFGELTLAAGTRLWRPTHRVLPGEPASVLASLNEGRRILLDDGSDRWYPDRPPYLGADGTLRLGDRIRKLEGVVGFAYGDFRIHPTRSIHFERVNRRPEAPPDVGGTLRVASVNLHNYMNGDGRGGGFPTPRGATSPYELTRQRDKLVETLALLDADAFALSEVENDGFAVESAIRELADALSRRSPSAPYVVARPDVPSLGVQVIAVGLLYRPAALLPLGPARVLDAHAHAAFDGRRNRPSLAQRFEARATGERFTVVVNHFKSKGSSCTAAGDPDRGDGQGNCNLVRSDAARALVEWLAADPGLAAGPDVLVLGDLNAYPFEDPIRAIQAAGYVDLVRWFEGPDAYSYVFDGEAGRLDHALASAGLLPRVSGAGVWHINADEPGALDYREDRPPDLYAPHPFRSSDHDPLLIGLFPDRDGDGLTDWRDACPDSRMGSSVVVGSCDSGVPNPVDESGCTTADRLADLLDRTGDPGRRAGHDGRPLPGRTAGKWLTGRDTGAPGRVGPRDLASLSRLSKRDLKEIRACLAHSRRP
jgi:predicted extracellular nuclease